MNDKFKKVCNNPPNQRYCQYCQGTSGLSREKEEVYLQIALDKLEGKEPSFIKKVSNFSQALVNHLKSGCESVSDFERDLRQEICNQCEFFDRNKSSCRLCGCNLNIKTWWSTSKCPENKWPDSQKLKEIEELHRDF